MLLGFIISSYVHFNSQPHEEADRRKEVWLYFYANFNSQPHEEADDIDEKNNVSQEDFNSQPHEEADDILDRKTADILIFQLTASRRG